MPPAAAFQTQACCCLRDACIPYAWRKEDAAGTLAGSPKSAGRGRSELELRVSSAGRAVYHPNAQGWMDIFAHAAGSYHCASRARLKLHGAVSFAAWGSLPTDHRACEVECEGWERPAQPHRRTCTHSAYHRRNTTRTARNRAAATRSRRNGARVLRSDRLLGLPPADRQSFGCSPAIEDVITQYPPNTRGFPRHVDGERRSSSWQPNIGIRGKLGGSRAAKPGRRAVMI